MLKSLRLPLQPKSKIDLAADMLMVLQGHPSLSEVLGHVVCRNNILSKNLHKYLQNKSVLKIKIQNHFLAHQVDSVSGGELLFSGCSTGWINGYRR